MPHRVLNAAARARALFNTILGVCVALLMTVVTVRFTIGGDDLFESVLLIVLTLAVWWQVRRFYSRYRLLSGERPLE